MQTGKQRSLFHCTKSAYITVVLAACLSPTLYADIDDLRGRVDRMEKMILQQQADLDAQLQKLDEQYIEFRQLKSELNNLEAEQTSPESAVESGPVDTYAQQGAATDAAGPAAEGKSVEEPTVDTEVGQQAAVAELARREEAGTAVRQVDSDATLYDPSNTLYDPDFPGAWHLPGTTAAMKIGGYANLAVVHNFDPLLATDSFIVGSIPPKGSDVTGARKGTIVTADQTRLNFEVREQTTRGPMRAFIEGDFKGDGSSFRLRHAFGQFGWLLAGKTWSAFANIEALPEEVDNEGVNGAILQRQSQLRFFPRLGENYNMMFSIEDPKTEIQNGAGGQGNGDLVLSVDRLPLGGLGEWKAKVAVISRDLKGQYTADGIEDSIEDHTRGWGITTSGRKPLTFWGDDDFVLWQVTYGKGLGHYINDLSTIGENDAVFDSQGKLHALPVFAGLLSYSHTWASKPWFLKDWPGIFRSNIMISWVNIENFEFQDDEAYDRTWRASTNLFYFPAQNVRLGAEFLWGERTNKDGSKGDATQLQVSARYSF